MWSQEPDTSSGRSRQGYRGTPRVPSDTPARIIFPGSSEPLISTRKTRRVSISPNRPFFPPRPGSTPGREESSRRDGITVGRLPLYTYMSRGGGSLSPGPHHTQPPDRCRSLRFDPLPHFSRTHSPVLIPSPVNTSTFDVHGTPVTPFLLPRVPLEPDHPLYPPSLDVLFIYLPLLRTPTPVHPSPWTGPRTSRAKDSLLDSDTHQGGRCLPAGGGTSVST